MRLIGQLFTGQLDALLVEAFHLKSHCKTGNIKFFGKTSNLYYNQHCQCMKG